VKISELFAKDVTRPIAPVIYFHEQAADKLAMEVGEYIVTGGWPKGHPKWRSEGDWIHEQYVSLLTGMERALGQPGGPSLPNCWLSGFYGSGKSAFAKLLGLSLDNRTLPDGRPLAEAWLAQDTSPKARELRNAWNALRSRLSGSIAVVFDIGGDSRDNEHVHSAVLRQVQRRLGYCTADPAVASYELGLERSGQYHQFLEEAERKLGMPWSQAKEDDFAADDFSQLMHALFPERFDSTTAWFRAHAGRGKGMSVTSAVKDIDAMLQLRGGDATLFLVVDEVSQYIYQDPQRMLKLQSFASELGSRLKGRAWLLALGQQKLEEASDQDVLGKMKGRFPKPLRVHLSPANIRDVVHQRLLAKSPVGEARLREEWSRHGASLELYAYRERGQELRVDDFVETYPLMPGHIGLLMRITSAMRTRSTRARGDDQAIRGLLQLLGELFRERKLAEGEVGRLVTLDQVYEVQHTALDADTQRTMERVLRYCHAQEDALAEACAKVVALLELIQDDEITTPELVARCLYDRLDRGDRLDAVERALEELRRKNLLGYHEKTGYKIQSTAGEEWDQERKNISALQEDRSKLVQKALTWLVDDARNPQHQGRSFPWKAWFTDNRRAVDVVLKQSRDPAPVEVDLRMLRRDEARSSEWIKRSDEQALRQRLVWIDGPSDQVDDKARELHRSQAMVRRYEARGELPLEKRRLLIEEMGRCDALVEKLRDAVEAAWMAGRLYFRGREIVPSDHGPRVPQVLEALGRVHLRTLFPHFEPMVVTAGELEQLVQRDLSGPSSKFLAAGLGLIEQEAGTGKYEARCSGAVPRRILARIKEEGGVGGDTLLSVFGRAPYGYHISLVKACTAALLRGKHIRAEAGSSRITSVRDMDARQTFIQDRAFRQASFLPGSQGPDPRTIRRLCRLLARCLNADVAREAEDLADAVADHFPGQLDRMRGVVRRLNKLPGPPPLPEALNELDRVLEESLRRARRTADVVDYLSRKYAALDAGLPKLAALNAEVTDPAVRAVESAARVEKYKFCQLEELDDDPAAEVVAAGERIRAQLTLPKPWAGIAGLDPDLERIDKAYREQRSVLLARQERLAERAREEVKSTEGWQKLNGDQRHQVLRPIFLACVDTDADSVAPALAKLLAPVDRAIASGKKKAIRELDRILEEIHRIPVINVELGRQLAYRKLKGPEEVESLLEEVRGILLEALEKGHVRLR